MMAVFLCSLSAQPTSIQCSFLGDSRLVDAIALQLSRESVDILPMEGDGNVDCSSRAVSAVCCGSGSYR